MIKIITRSSNSSSRNVIRWLEAQDLDYVEINLSKYDSKLKREELIHILSLCENGINDIVSKRKTYSPELSQKLLELDELPFSIAVNTLLDNLEVLYIQIIFDEKKLQTGFHREDIRQFVSRSKRRVVFGDNRVIIIESLKGE